MELETCADLGYVLRANPPGLSVASTWGHKAKKALRNDREKAGGWALSCGLGQKTPGHRLP